MTRIIALVMWCNVTCQGKTERIWQLYCGKAHWLNFSSDSPAENLLYMPRLGLWGEGTAFRSKLDFVLELKNRGVGEHIAASVLLREVLGAVRVQSRPHLSFLQASIFITLGQHLQPSLDRRS